MSNFELGARARDAGYRLSGFDTVGSTNVEAVSALKSGDAGRHWFTALQQTQGRGRRGRPWVSAYGNLAASLLLVPGQVGDKLPTLGFVAGVALNHALKTIAPELGVNVGLDGADMGQHGRFSLKWPNDVLADGAKLAGILLEAHVLPNGQSAVVIGCGINVVEAPKDTPYPATSLVDMGYNVSAESVFQALAEAWVGLYEDWDDGRGLPLVLEKWRHSAAGLGGDVVVKQDGEIIRGVFEALDDEGRLIVRTQDGARTRITAGDVHFGATASVRES